MNLSQNLKLAAVDLDGTLLGEGGVISPENLDAIKRLQSVGIKVVLASGRHHNSMRPYGEALPGVHWMVSSQGAELSDVARKLF